MYGSDFGLWSLNCGETIRHRHYVHGDNVFLLYNITPEASAYLGNRSLADIARSTTFNSRPDAFCVSGMTASMETPDEDLRTVKMAAPAVPVFINTGVGLGNVERQLSLADGAIIGTAFKENGYIWGPVDRKRVESLMRAAKACRK